MKAVMVFFVVCLLSLAAPIWADTRGSVHGKLFDPTDAVVPATTVQLISVLDGQTKTSVTDAEGHFNFLFLDAGPYKLSATVAGFRAVEEQVTIVAGRLLEVNLKLRDLSNVAEEVTVSDSAGEVEYASSVQVGLSRQTIEHVAGASESLNAVEAYSGTAWRSQEHLHIRGAHQIGFEVNGIPIPDQSLFGAVTPFVDPRNFKYAEITAGGLLPEFGNRTAGVINAITRSGFDSGPRGRLEIAGGNLGRGSAFAAFGDHVGERFAYYVQSSTLTSRRGFNPPPDRIVNVDTDGNGKVDALDTPKRQDRHNYRRSFQSFANFEWLPSGTDALNFVLGGYRSDFQIPNTVYQQKFGRDYVQFERDQFQNLRWTRSLSAETLLTVSGYHHFNKVEVSGRSDEPTAPLANDNRRANYYGVDASVARHFGRHLFKIGNAVFRTTLRDDFSVLPNPAAIYSTSFSIFSRVPANSWEESVYVQDQFDVTERLSMNFGGRLDTFSATYERQAAPSLSLRETFFGPRAGASYKISDHVTWFVNGAYLFLPPPIEFFEFPADATGLLVPQGVSFTPTRPERDVQYDVGVRLRVKGQKVRINQWFKRQIRFLDHVQVTQPNPVGELINTNIFLPVNLDRGRTHGVEAFFESSSYRGLSGFVNYSLNYSQATGGVLYGFNAGSESEKQYFFVDHDQRHRVFAGLDYNIESVKAFVNVTYGFGSGFPDASDGVFGRCVTAACRLPKHSELNLTLGKSLTNNVAARVEIENLTNNIYPINLGSDFNGSHVSQPRMATFRMTYQF